MATPKRSLRTPKTTQRAVRRRRPRAIGTQRPAMLPGGPPDRQPTAEPLVPIVGIGASAGGLEALETFFTHMPPDNGMAFVVVTHMDPHATSFLPELLSRTTPMLVREAADGQTLAENAVLVMPPGKHLALEQGLLRVRDAIVTPHGVPLPIDAFFRSLAEDQQEKAMGIILSGTGTDGTLGARAIKSASGMIMVQDIQSARFTGMPQSAVATGLVDYVLSPDQMPAALLAYVRGPYLTRSAATPADFAISPEVLQEMLSLLHTHTGHSFAAYKISTIHRRIERRLTLHQMTQPEQYLRYLREHPEEIDTLFNELLIGVTSFFRDPAAFTVLASTVLPALLANKRDGEPVRVWVAGCSTGEEVYSLAMVLHECLGQLRKPCAVQIFATDLDAQAINIARRGLYPEGIAADVTPERLQRYFTHEDTAYRTSKELRDMVIFAVHNLLTDPPFTHMDLLSCRNLLIYLDTNAQHHLLTLFHYALRSGGVLFLGASETIGNLGALFTTLDGQWKLFARNDEVPFPSPLPEHAVALFSPTTSLLRSSGEPMQLGTRTSRAEAYLAQRFAPPSVLITAHGDIVHFHGRTGAYLEPPRGQPSLNIFRMARQCLTALSDITTRKQAEEALQAAHDELEQRVLERTTALAAAYEELKRFANVVSHDLRAPLINVQGFTRELAQACAVLQAVLPTAFPSLDNAQRAAVTTVLEGDIPEALGFIHAGVARMNELLDAMFTLSRMGHRPFHFEALDMEELVQQCLQTLAHQLRERQVGVTVGPLPQVHADYLAMTQIVSHLLSNALNALVPGRPGELRITATAGPETTAFHIQDNGRGMATEDIPKVFEVFHRLAPQEVAGAGMGLAYVRALVHRHGGDVGCQSTPGVGTTFTFTIAHNLAESPPPQHTADATVP